VAHAEAVQRLVVDRGRHFEPAIVDAFMACHSDFEVIREQVSRTESQTERPSGYEGSTEEE